MHKSTNILYKHSEEPARIVRKWDGKTYGIEFKKSKAKVDVSLSDIAICRPSNFVNFQYTIGSELRIFACEHMRTNTIFHMKPGDHAMIKKVPFLQNVHDFPCTVTVSEKGHLEVHRDGLLVASCLPMERVDADDASIVVKPCTPLTLYEPVKSVSFAFGPRGPCWKYRERYPLFHLSHDNMIKLLTTYKDAVLLNMCETDAYMHNNELMNSDYDPISGVLFSCIGKYREFKIISFLHMPEKFYVSVLSFVIPNKLIYLASEDPWSTDLNVQDPLSRRVIIADKYYIGNKMVDVKAVMSNGEVILSDESVVCSDHLCVDANTFMNTQMVILLHMCSWYHTHMDEMTNEMKDRAECFAFAAYRIINRCQEGMRDVIKRNASENGGCLVTDALCRTVVKSKEQYHCFMALVEIFALALLMIMEKACVLVPPSDRSCNVAVVMDAYGNKLIAVGELYGIPEITLHKIIVIESEWPITRVHGGLNETIDRSKREMESLNMANALIEEDDKKRARELKKTKQKLKKTPPTRNLGAHRRECEEREKEETCLLRCTSDDCVVSFTDEDDGTAWTIVRRGRKLQQKEDDNKSCTGGAQHMDAFESIPPTAPSSPRQALPLSPLCASSDKETLPCEDSFRLRSEKMFLPSLVSDKNLPCTTSEIERTRRVVRPKPCEPHKLCAKSMKRFAKTKVSKMNASTTNSQAVVDINNIRNQNLSVLYQNVMWAFNRAHILDKMYNSIHNLLSWQIAKYLSKKNGLALIQHLLREDDCTLMLVRVLRSSYEYISDEHVVAHTAYIHSTRIRVDIDMTYVMIQ